LLVALPDAPVVPVVVELLDAPVEGEVRDEDEGEVAELPLVEPMPELAPLVVPAPLVDGEVDGELVPDAEALVLPDAPLLLEAVPLSPEVEDEAPDGFIEPVAEPELEPMPEADPVAEPLALGPEPAQAANASAHVRGNIHFVMRTPLVVKKTSCGNAAHNR
jgi:hypothetical protein